MPAPTLAQLRSADWQIDTSTSRLASNPLDVYVGDIVVACGATTNPSHTISFSGGTNTTWTARNESNTNTRAAIWTCTVSAYESFTPTVSRSGGAVSAKFGAVYYVFRGTTGRGATSASSGVGPAGAIINTTGTTYPSAIVVLAVDSNGGVDSENPATWLENAGAFQSYVEEYADPNWTVIHCGLHPSTTQGSYSVGHSFPSNQYYDVVTLEIYGGPVPSVADIGWLTA